MFRLYDKDGRYIRPFNNLDALRDYAERQLGDDWTYD